MKLKHVQTVRKMNGKTYRYLRVPGKKRVKLPDLPPDHPEFLRAYLAQLGSAEPAGAPAPGTIGALVAAFLQSGRFLALSGGYRPTIRRHADAIRTRAASAMTEHLRADHIRADCAPLAPHAARARRKAWRLICAYAVETGLLRADPSDGVKARKVPPTDGHLPWTLDQIAAFRAHWSPETVQRRAFELLYWTGARTVDAVALGRGNVGRDGVLAFVQSKTGQSAFVPWSCTLPPFASTSDHAHLMSALAHAPAQMNFLATEGGRSRTAKGLSNLISDAAKAAGIEARSAHGLRKSRTIALVEGGATEAQGMSWTGHLTSNEFAHYAKARNRRAAVIGTEEGRGIVNTTRTGT